MFPGSHVLFSSSQPNVLLGSEEGRAGSREPTRKFFTLLCSTLFASSSFSPHRTEPARLASITAFGKWRGEFRTQPACSNPRSNECMNPNFEFVKCSAEFPRSGRFCGFQAENELIKDIRAKPVSGFNAWLTIHENDTTYPKVVANLGSVDWISERARPFLDVNLRFSIFQTDVTIHLAGSEIANLIQFEAQFSTKSISGEFRSYEDGFPRLK
ncbi:hypothetical protein L596_018736 [Steinernema carpocapsae]|uniref:Uncharacterized protein n=1 Tax=Steinernema carpocapsae TaxID=34508 RepID=A0A4U5N6M6_STECR|nr:hypothetical protein L596_018736 [Steinernema carpocapsae]